MEAVTKYPLDFSALLAGKRIWWLMDEMDFDYIFLCTLFRKHWGIKKQKNKKLLREVCFPTLFSYNVFHRDGWVSDMVNVLSVNLDGFWLAHSVSIFHQVLVKLVTCATVVVGVMVWMNDF